ncbi:MAG: CPBP family intramembrane glutamic endopeptidase [Pseudomonadota bacterium]
MSYPDRGYTPHAGFVAVAGDRAELWRTAAGIVVAIVAGIALYQLTMAMFAWVLGPDAMRQILDEASYYGDTPRAVLITLFSYVFFAVGLAMALVGLHERGLLSLLGPWEGALSDFLRSFMVLTGLYLVLTLLLPTDAGLIRNDAMRTGLWLALLPLSLLAIAVQAGTEEAFFRGYLQQQLAARFAGWPAWLLVPSALFGLAHFSPETAGPNATSYMLWAMLFGLLAADLTARTGTLGAALGLHIATNAFALLGTAMAGPGSGLALYLVPLEIDAPELGALMPAEFLTIIIAWLLVRLTLRV